MGHHTPAGTAPLIAGGAVADGNRGAGDVVASTIALQSRKTSVGALHQGVLGVAHQRPAGSVVVAEGVDRVES